MLTVLSDATDASIRLLASAYLAQGFSMIANENPEAREWVKKEDESCLEERIGRLEWLIGIYPEVELFVFPGGLLTKQLFEEARYSFVYGQFAASILLSLAFVERCLASLFFSAGRDDLKRANLSKLVNEAHELRIINTREFDQLDHMRRVRNPLVHFREYGHPDRTEIRAVRSLYQQSELAMLPEEIVANDAVAALRLAMHFLERLCVPESFELFVFRARR